MPISKKLWLFLAIGVLSLCVLIVARTGNTGTGEEKSSLYLPKGWENEKLESSRVKQLTKVFEQQFAVELKNQFSDHDGSYKILLFVKPIQVKGENPTAQRVANQLAVSLGAQLAETPLEASKLAVENQYQTGFYQLIEPTQYNGTQVLPAIFVPTALDKAYFFLLIARPSVELVPGQQALQSILSNSSLR